MTVDMLAATFFWPEGTLPGPHHSRPTAGEPAAEGREATEPAVGAEGLWSAVFRHIRRLAISPVPRRGASAQRPGSL